MGRNAGSGGGGKHGGLDFEDFQLWKAFTRDIDPLEERGWEDDMIAPPTTSEKIAPRERRASAASPAIQTRQPPVPQPVQLDGRTDSRLRRGRLPIEGRLDLHGYNQERAREVLRDFVTAAHGRGKRCLLVITGKGRVGEDGVREGILRQKFPQWMGEPPLGSIVLKYYPAQQKDGGGGAWYIYLKRERTPV